MIDRIQRLKGNWLKDDVYRQSRVFQYLPFIIIIIIIINVFFVLFYILGTLNPEG